MEPYVMEPNVSEKIKILAKRKKIPLSKIASKMGISRLGLHKKMSRNALTEKDMNEIAKILGIKIVIDFQYPDGTEN